MAFAEQQAKIAITARSREELTSLAIQIEQKGSQALVLADDLTERTTPARLINAVKQKWGDVNVLINNAGIGSSQSPKPLVEFDDDFWDLTMALNVTAPYLLTKAALPGMIRAQWGRIINVSSINARVPAFHGAAYTSSKHAIAGLTKATAREVGELGITANAICPGVTATLMNDKRLQYDAERLGKTVEDLEAAASPLGRRLTPDEIAPLAVFLAGDGAAAINGQLLNVCGGTVMF
jgi:NAD(P)-dependent dehydrogenase (short-subunit alcohol dehydrogenase family)